MLLDARDNVLEQLHLLRPIKVSVFDGMSLGALLGTDDVTHSQRAKHIHEQQVSCTRLGHLLRKVPLGDSLVALQDAHDLVPLLRLQLKLVRLQSVWMRLTRLIVHHVDRCGLSVPVGRLLVLVVLLEYLSALLGQLGSC